MLSVCTTDPLVWDGLLAAGVGDGMLLGARLLLVWHGGDELMSRQGRVGIWDVGEQYVHECDLGDGSRMLRICIGMAAVTWGTLVFTNMASGMGQ